MLGTWKREERARRYLGYEFCATGGTQRDSPVTTKDEGP